MRHTQLLQMGQIYFLACIMHTNMSGNQLQSTIFVRAMSSITTAFMTHKMQQRLKQHLQAVDIPTIRLSTLSSSKAHIYLCVGKP